MDNKSYSFGVKIVSVILHFFFTVILTICLFLIGTLIDKNILEFTDIGTNQFLNSGYYTQCIQQKCDNLGEYLFLMEKGADRTPEEDRKYLQYTDEFKSEDTNFCFWYKRHGVWYTNQPDTHAGQVFDAEAVEMEARSMGDYLLYDMENQVFGTDVKKLSNAFFESPKTQLYWPPQGVILIIGIDIQFSAPDDLYYASEEYHQIQPWIKTALLSLILSLMGWMITLVYLTLATGRRNGDYEIHLNVFDHIKTEFLFMGLVAVMVEMIFVMSRIIGQEWELYGLMVAAATVSLVSDAVFLGFYLSVIKLMKAEKLWENSLLYWLRSGIEKAVKNKNAAVQTMLFFAAHLLLCFLFAVGAFHYESGICFLLLVLVCAAEGYFILRKSVEQYRILEGAHEIKEGAINAKIDVTELHGDNKRLAAAINNISLGLEQAVAESTKNERMKADLITNVSHDIKTPLTSIVNYVNLLKRENIDNERARGYIEILDEKAARLKQLTEDLVEASKVSSGNVKLDMQTIDLVEMVYQTAGEFDEKFEAKRLTIVTRLPNNPVYICADGRQLYRVIENLYNNVAKYAMEHTRVYVDLLAEGERVVFSVKNVSEKALAEENSLAGDLTERFMRGDSSRATEGSGLGLSIAKSLTQLMGGSFEISVDGDLFKAILIFVNQSMVENAINVKEI